MPCCKAWGCASNGTEEGVRRHRFPKDPYMIKLWIAKINREDFREKDIKASAFLCSKHFTDADYETSPALLKDMNINYRPNLKNGTIPSIFPHKQPRSSRRSTAAEKRKRAQVN